MRALELEAYAKTNYLGDAHPPVGRALQPHLSQLIAALISLPEGSPSDEVLRLFETCIEAINDDADDIQTVEREAVLAAIYEIGALVGLDPDSRFADRWRGDW